MVQRHQKREYILRGAARVMTQRGYHGSSMREIADRCGLQKGSLYHYFTSKEDILEGITRRSISKFKPGLAAIVVADSPAQVKLRESIWHHISTLCSNLDYPAVLLEEFWHLPNDYQDAIRAERVIFRPVTGRERFRY